LYKKASVDISSSPNRSSGLDLRKLLRRDKSVESSSKGGEKEPGHQRKLGPTRACPERQSYYPFSHESVPSHQCSDLQCICQTFSCGKSETSSIENANNDAKACGDRGDYSRNGLWDEPQYICGPCVGDDDVMDSSTHHKSPKQDEKRQKGRKKYSGLAEQQLPEADPIQILDKVSHSTDS